MSKYKADGRLTQAIRLIWDLFDTSCPENDFISAHALQVIHFKMNLKRNCSVSLSSRPLGFSSTGSQLDGQSNS